MLGIKGYCTNLPEQQLSNQMVIDRYHQLWHIEQSFRMSKFDLQTRPIIPSKTRSNHGSRTDLFCRSDSRKIPGNNHQIIIEGNPIPGLEHYRNPYPRSTDKANICIPFPNKRNNKKPTCKPYNQMEFVTALIVTSQDRRKFCRAPYSRRLCVSFYE